MSNHDPLCQASLNGNDDIFFCVCEFIAKVRADESRLAYEDVIGRSRQGHDQLRAAVQALRDRHGPGRAHDHEYTYPCSHCDALEEVLALFDRSSE